MNEKALALATRINTLRAELKSVEAEFSSLTGATKVAAPARRKPAGRGSGPSISQRVLAMVVQAGRTGIASRDLIAVIDNKEAVHSALQAHRTGGRIVNDGGQWCVSQGYAEELSAPHHVPVTETKPLRHPAGGEYLGNH